MTGRAMQALEKRSNIRAMTMLWQRAFGDGAEVIGTMSGKPVLWHEHLGIWGMFGKTAGKGGGLRAWNAFGQKAHNFRSNIIVEINMPSRGIDQNLQAVFAADREGRHWLLHQGRMSVAGSRVTEADFITATGLDPTEIRFSDGTKGAYHKVADLSGSPATIQDQVAAFIAQCAHARLSKLAGGTPIAGMDEVAAWERGLNPESSGTSMIAPRARSTGQRVHGEIWRVLATALEQRKTPHSNDRVGQYGPDLFTYGAGPKVLFEIKSRCGAHDIFEGVGQLHIYDRLLGGGYRKVLVVPDGIGEILREPIASLAIDTVTFHREGKRIVLDQSALNECLKSRN